MGYAKQNNGERVISCFRFYLPLSLAPNKEDIVLGPATLEGFFYLNEICSQLGKDCLKT